MEQARSGGIMLVSHDENVRFELEWTVKRAGLPEEVEWLADPGEVRDTLTLRVRDQLLPRLLFIDLRTDVRNGSQLLKWVAGSEGLSQILIVVLASGSSAEDALHLLGADVVATTLPNAAKLAQLFGIADRLSSISERLTEPRLLAAESITRPARRKKR